MQIKKLLGLLLMGSTIVATAQESKSVTKRLPAYRTEEEKALSIIRSKQATPQQSTLNKTGVLPADIRYPGEFEESQAVMISWPYDFDNNDNPFIDTGATYGQLWAKLANEIQKTVPVIIRVDEAKDTAIVATHMRNRGTPLFNYQFMIKLGDAWWMRDFGPHGVYYGAADSLAFIDLKYYDGRDNDDIWAKHYAQEIGKPVYTSRLNGEGGNLMTDGYGTIFFSTVFDEVNTNGMIVNPAFSEQEVQDTISALFGTKVNKMLQALSCDGGTGHIDLYIKMIDEQTIMAAQYPEVITASDRKTIEDNLQLIASLKTVYDKPFKVYRIPHPTADNGTYTRRTCAQMNADARTFVNGLTVNNKFIFPSYSNATTGNKTQTQEVKSLFENIMPGYEVVDIDARLLSPLGGEIHCITMQVPAENPVQFWHPAINGYFEQPASSYHIIAKIRNRSGIQSAVCKWRLKGQTNYNTVNLTDSSGYFIGDIVPGALTSSDEIEYHLQATTNNGKTAYKPMGAPNGNYNIHFAIRSKADEYLIQAKNYLFNVYPNPVRDVVNFTFYAETADEVKFTVQNMSGITVKEVSGQKATVGLNGLQVNLEELPSGIYFYSYYLNNQLISVRKFVKE